MFVKEIRDPRQLEGGNVKKYFDTLNRIWKQIIRPGLEPNPLKGCITDGFGQGHGRASEHHRLNQVRVHLSHLEPNHPTITQPHQAAPLHA